MSSGRITPKVVFLLTEILRVHMKGERISVAGQNKLVNCWPGME